MDIAVYPKMISAIAHEKHLPGYEDYLPGRIHVVVMAPALAAESPTPS